MFSPLWDPNIIRHVVAFSNPDYLRDGILYSTRTLTQKTCINVAEGKSATAYTLIVGVLGDLFSLRKKSLYYYLLGFFAATPEQSSREKERHVFDFEPEWNEPLILRIDTMVVTIHVKEIWSIPKTYQENPILEMPAVPVTLEGVREVISLYIDQFEHGIYSVCIQPCGEEILVKVTEGRYDKKALYHEEVGGMLAGYFRIAPRRYSIIKTVVDNGQCWRLRFAS